MTIDFMVALIGASGTLKTNMARRFCMILQDVSSQEIQFSDFMRNFRVQSTSEKLKSFVLLMDDFHPVQKVATQERFLERLDICSRIATTDKKAAFVVVTAEEFVDCKSVSMYDRILQIHTDAVTELPEEKFEELKDKLFSLESGAMVTIIMELIKRIVSDYQQFRQLISEFEKNYRNPEFVDSTLRISKQIKMILLAEFIYRSYMCEKEREMSHFDDLMMALKENALIQSSQLYSMRKHVKKINYVYEISKIIEEGTDCKDLDIVMARKKFESNQNMALRDEGYFYIRSETLVRVLVKRTQKMISSRELLSILSKAGILREQGGKHTCNINNVRLVVIDMNAVKLCLKFSS